MFEQVIAPGSGRGQLGKGLLASVGLHGALLGVALLLSTGTPARKGEPLLTFVTPRAWAHPAGAAPKAAPAAKAHAASHRHRRAVTGKRILPTEQAVQEVELGDALPDAAAPSSDDGPAVVGGLLPGGSLAGLPGAGEPLDFDSSGTMTPPRLIEGSAPGYTADALRAGVEGTIVARCVITTAGAVEHCRILRGLPLLDRSVLASLAQQRYAPVTFEGHPVAVNYVFTFRFVLPR